MTRRARYLMLLAMLTAAMPAASAGAAGSTARGENPLIVAGESLAQVQLSSPSWYAIVLQKPARIRLLYSKKDVLFDARHPGESLTIVQVDPDTLVFREGAGNRLRSLRAGNPIPGFPGLFFTGTVKLDQLHFRYKPVERIAHTDPVLIALEGSRAVLEVEVLRSSATAGGPLSQTATLRKLDPAVFEQVRVKAIGKHAYEIASADVRPVIEGVGQMFANLKPMLLPLFSQQTGMTWHLTSAVADGDLTQGGFTVTNLKTARYFGIESGDTIFRINGYSVTSPFSAYWAYQEAIARNPLLSELRVDLIRGGAPITKIYRIQ
jgi:hypothetical protein